MMKSKTLIATLALATSLSLATTASADSTRDQMEQQGNQHVEQLWSEYQQAMQDRQNIWNQTGDRFSDDYIKADAHAGAALQEYERAKSQLGDQLHNYDVDQAQKTQQSNQPASQTSQQQATATQAKMTKAISSVQQDKPAATSQQAEQSANQASQESHSKTMTNQSNNLSNQSQNAVQAKPVASAKGQLPQAGNAVSWLAPLIGMFGLGLAVKEVKHEKD